MLYTRLKLGRDSTRRPSSSRISCSDTTGPRTTMPRFALTQKSAGIHVPHNFFHARALGRARARCESLSSFTHPSSFTRDGCCAAAMKRVQDNCIKSANVSHEDHARSDARSEEIGETDKLPSDWRCRWHTSFML